MAEDHGSLFQLFMDGELVAEAPLVIKDEALAWKAFTAVFAVMSQNLVGEFFETMRIACDPELRKSMGPQKGFKIDLSTKPKPKLFVPAQTNGAPQAFN